MLKKTQRRIELGDWAVRRTSFVNRDRATEKEWVRNVNKVRSSLIIIFIIVPSAKKKKWSYLTHSAVESKNQQAGTLPVSFIMRYDLILGVLRIT